MRRRIDHILLVILILFALSACQPPIRNQPLPPQIARVPFNSPNAIIARPLQFPAAVPSYVTFAPNSIQLSADTRVRLDRQAAYMTQNPQFLFQLFGHADTYGPQELNDRIAQARAETVRNYLISRGVPRRILLPIISLGESEPLDLVLNANHINRRVVVELYNPV